MTREAGGPVGNAGVGPRELCLEGSSADEDSGDVVRLSFVSSRDNCGRGLRCPQGFAGKTVGLGITTPVFRRQ